MLRAIYFSVKYNLKLSDEIKDAIKTNAKLLNDDIYLAKINIALKTTHFMLPLVVRKMFELLNYFGIAEIIFPGIGKNLLKEIFISPGTDTIGKLHDQISSPLSKDTR